MRVNFRSLDHYGEVSASYDGRFLLMRRTDGVSLFDRRQQDVVRCECRATARAVADLRAGIPPAKMETHRTKVSGTVERRERE